MAAHVHLLPRAVSAGQPAPPATALLQASGNLWAAPDLDSVVATASSLLVALIPGAVVERKDRHEAAGAGDGQLQITLSRHEVLVVTPPPGHDDPALLDAAAELIAARIDALDQRTALAESVEQLGRSERLQRALYAIADQASAAGTDLHPMFRALHAIVGSLMYAENFYIVLYDAKRDTVRFPYYADTVDPELPFPGSDLPMADLRHGPTWYVLREGKPLMGSPEAMPGQVHGPFHIVGAAFEDWLGVPLLHGNEVAGCVVVQSYDKTHHYDEQDKALLIYVAQHVQTALERRLAHVDLERRVEERTLALSKANDVLQQEVLERQRGERLQAALFRIAELASSTDQIEEFYASIHRIVDDLIEARNFCIALVSEDGTELGFPYSVDECDRENPTRKLGNGLTEYVLLHGAPLLADKSEITRLRDAGAVGHYGAMA
jgi:GAF domain-containing protein